VNVYAARNESDRTTTVTITVSDDDILGANLPAIMRRQNMTFPEYLAVLAEIAFQMRKLVDAEHD